MSLRTSRSSRRSTASARPRRSLGGGVDVLLAASLWGTTGTARTFADGASSASVAARIVIGGALLFGLAAATRRDGLRRLLARRGDRALLALGAGAIAVYQVAFFVAVARTGVAAGTVVTIGGAPAFTGLIGLVTRRSVLTGRRLLATAGAVAGCALLVGAGAGSGIEPVGIGLALLAASLVALIAPVPRPRNGGKRGKRGVSGDELV